MGLVLFKHSSYIKNFFLIKQGIGKFSLEMLSHLQVYMYLNNNIFYFWRYL